jgi:hypothetical protein
MLRVFWFEVLIGPEMEEDKVRTSDNGMAGSMGRRVDSCRAYASGLWISLDVGSDPSWHPGSLQRCEFSTKIPKPRLGSLWPNRICLENPAPITMTIFYADPVETFRASGQTWSDVAGRLGAQRHEGLHLFGAVPRRRVARPSAASKLRLCLQLRWGHEAHWELGRVGSSWADGNLL